jgi:tetratricopeptide (TPR) repeat protein
MKQFMALAILVSVSPATAQDKVEGKAQARPRRTVRSFLDADPISMKADLEQLFQEHQLLPASSKEAVKPDPALKRLREGVDKASDAEARASLAKAPLAKTARGLTAMAAAAVLKDNRTAALAALLLAVEKEPADVDARVNLAGVAASLGFAAEALALLEGVDEKAVASSGMGAPGRSVVLAIRGHALVAQRRYAEAKDALKQAVAPAPYFSEAWVNLALALKGLREEDEAKRAFFMGAWRRPVNKLVCGTDAAPTGDPIQDAFRDDATTRPAASEIFDLAEGVVGTLPRIPHATNLEEVGKLGKWAETELAKAADRATALRKEILRLSELVGARPQTLTEKRARRIHELIGEANEEPELKPIWLPLDDHDALSKQVGRILADGQKEFLEIVKLNLDEAALKQRIDALSNRLIPQINPLAKKLDQMARDWWAPAHKHKTGLAANLKNDEWHDLAIATIRHEADVFFGVLAVEIHGWYVGCTFDNARPKDGAAGDAPQNANVPGCSGEAKKWGIEIEITRAFKLNVNCEEIGLELEADVFPGLGGFAKLEIERDGLTVQIGAKGEIGVPGVGPTGSVKNGAYVEVGREGIRDLGFEVSIEAGVNVPGAKVTREIDTMQFSFMPTPGR